MGIPITHLKGQSNVRVHRPTILNERTEFERIQRERRLNDIAAVGMGMIALGVLIFLTLPYWG